MKKDCKMQMVCLDKNESTLCFIYDVLVVI